MNSQGPLGLGFVSSFVGGVIVSLLLMGIPTFAQELPQHPEVVQSPVNKNALSEKEHLEYLSLVGDIQEKLWNDYQFFPHTFGDPGTIIRSWFHTIGYVKGAQVETPLLISDPPQVRVHLQVELTSKKRVRDEVSFYLPLKPQILY